MTRQAINLIGLLAVAAILVVGLLLGALPHWHNARDTDAQRQLVESQNDGQQQAIDAAAVLRKRLPELQAEVATLRSEIADGAHLEQIIALAPGLPAGAVLRSVMPTPTEGTPEAPTADGFSALPVTVVVDVRRPADAAAAVDALRAGPRLLAVDQVSLAPGGGAGGTTYTVTVAGRVFLHPVASAPSPTATTTETGGATP